jgi:hypothetical protein
LRRQSPTWVGDGRYLILTSTLLEYADALVAS